MNFMDAVKSGYQNYVNFAGRSSRSAFWWWALFQVIVSVVIGAVEGGGWSQMSGGMSGGMMEAGFNAGPIAIVWSLANLLPGLALAVRRMHDIERSGWWVLINLIPLVGVIIYLVWACQKGTSGTNRFGADPLAA